MATYRPKKLDEINSVFGESVKAQEAIKQVSSGVSDEKLRPEGGAASAEAVEDGFRPVPTQAAVEDISAVADEFIMRFGTPERAAATVRLHESEAMKAKVIPTGTPVKAKPVTPVAGETPEAEREAVPTEKQAPVAPPKATSAPVISRVSPLMEDYQRVMNDEDDDGPTFRIRKKEKKGKKKKGRAARIYEEETALEPTEETETLTDEAIEDEVPVVHFEVPEEFRDYVDTPAEEAVEETAHDDYEIVSEEICEEEAPAEADTVEAPAEAVEYTDDEEEALPEDDYDYEDILSRYDDEEEIAEIEENKDIFSNGTKTSGKGRKVARVMLSVFLVLTMLAACGVGAAKLILGVDTCTLVADRYYLFTSDADYPFVGIEKGDLVVTENIFPSEDECFVYADSDSETFVFAKQKGTYVNYTGDVIYVAEIEGQRNTVYRDDTKGVIVKTVPVIGEFISVLSDYYIIVIVMLLCLAVILLLIVIFGLSGKHETAEPQEDAAPFIEYEDIYSSTDRMPTETEEE